MERVVRRGSGHFVQQRVSDAAARGVESTARSVNHASAQRIHHQRLGQPGVQRRQAHPRRRAAGVLPTQQQQVLGHQLLSLTAQAAPPRITAPLSRH
jgi:hypothetical protein